MLTVSFFCILPPEGVEEIEIHDVPISVDKQETCILKSLRVLLNDAFPHAYILCKRHIRRVRVLLILVHIHGDPYSNDLRPGRDG